MNRSAHTNEPRQHCIITRFRVAPALLWCALLLLACLLFETVQAQTVGPNSLLSVNVAGTNSGNNGSGLNSSVPRASISAGGRFVVFQSDATDLVANNTRLGQIYVRDLATNTTTLASVNRTNTNGGNGISINPQISDDGRFVAFESLAPDLVVNDTNGGSDVFVRDLATGTTTLASVNRTGADSARGSQFLPTISFAPVLSANGRVVVFQSYSNEIVANDSNDSADLFARDLSTGTTVAVNVNRAGVPSGNRSSLTSGGSFNFQPVISDDGQIVAFTSYSNDLVANDNVCAGTCNGTNGLADVFARDLFAGTTTLASVNRAGATGGNASSTDPSISANGRIVAFKSFATDLVGNDTTPQSDIYVRDIAGGTTTLVSVNRTNTNGGANNNGGVNSSSPLISPNGRFVAFSSSATDLAANKTSTFGQDVFVRDIVAGTTVLASVNLAGVDSTSGFNLVATASDFSDNGRFLVFESGAPDLVLNDINNTRDVFVRDLFAGSTIAVSVNRTGNASGNGSSSAADISDDGRIVAFNGNSTDLVANDSNGDTDVFARAIFQANQLQFSVSNTSVNESAGTATVTVTRTNGSSGEATVDYETTDGSATQKSDYTFASGTLRFASGETSKTFTVLITDDAYDESNETLTITLRNPSGAGALGSPSITTLTIVDNDTGQPATNPIDDAQFFVRQQYLDFLNREPDAGGLAYWTNQITQCGANVPCIRERRTAVSAAFFVESEFQETGFFVYRFYKAAFGVRPRFADFIRDRSRVVGGSDLEASKQAFAEEFVQRPEFALAYPPTLSSAQFIDALLLTVRQSSGADLSRERSSLISDFNANRSRARILRLIIENQLYVQAEYNRAFVLAQYFGYLRRDPDEAGYQFWLNVLNNRDPNNYRAMVCAFITSKEYQDRFSPITTRTNADCGP